jgi:SAM-dependent methyltransferase
MMEVSGLQKSFYARADGKRFRNRLQNPFLQTKEKTIAGRMVSLMPAGTLRVLEIGCGEGSNLRHLMDVKPDCYYSGLDFSPEKAVFLKSNCPETGAVCADALQLPFVSEAFDFVFCRDLLHHVDWDRKGVVAEAMRVLKRGGCLVIVESDGRTLLNRTFQYFLPVERGMRNSTPDTLLALGRAFGQPQLDYLEASFAVRAVGFFLGWPGGVFKWVVIPIYGLASLWEKTMAALLPRKYWPYLIMRLPKS